MTRSSKLWIIPALSALACCAMTAWAPDRTITLESLLSEMVNRDAVARWPAPAFICKQASSYDRASVTPNDPNGWFANNDWSQFVRTETNQGRKEYVFMDVDGPGCIVRLWAGGPPPTGKLRFYLDGSENPAIEMPMWKGLSGEDFVPVPLAIQNVATPGNNPPGGLNLYLPIPFAKRCKVTYGPMQSEEVNDWNWRWYNICYRVYAASTKVKTFTMADYEAAKARVQTVCKTLLAARTATEGKRVSVSKAMEPGRDVSVSLPKGPAAVRALEVKLDAANLEQALRSTVIAISFDGKRTVWCPVGDFFGSGTGLNPFQDWYRTVTKDGRMIVRWVMPYRKSAKITLVNYGKEKAAVGLKALVGKWKWDDRSMYFHGNWRQQSMRTDPLKDWNYIEAKGQGVYVGDTLSVMNPVTAWWGEGDEKIYVDGETFPSFFGTGTEDYYCYSYGKPVRFEGHFAAQPRVDGPGNKGHTVNSRVRSLDGIRFTRSLRFDMEVWHWDRNIAVYYGVATFWYARPGATCNIAPAPDEAAKPVPQAPN